jgi:hypothetical protein
MDDEVSGNHSGACAYATCRSFGSPFFDFRKELTWRHGGRTAAVARVPIPEYEWGVHDLFNRTMTVLLWIFEQFTELMVRQPLRNHRHRGRGQMPIGSSRRHVQAHPIGVAHFISPRICRAGCLSPVPKEIMIRMAGVIV